MKFFITDSYNHLTPVTLSEWALVKDLKDYLQDQLSIPANKQRLFYGNSELKNTHRLHDCHLVAGCYVYLSVTSNSNYSDSNSSDLIAIYGNVPCPNEFITESILPARQGLSIGLKPILSMEGTGMY